MELGSGEAAGVVAHQRQFLEREFGLEVAAQLQPVMQEAYRLAYIRKPEFMGNTVRKKKILSLKLSVICLGVNKK